METLKIKMEMTQVVKTLFIILIAAPHFLLAQVNIKGQYDGAIPGDSGGITLLLTNDNRFVEKVSMHLGEGFISTGYYFLKRDTLILFHEALKDPAPSYYEVIEKTDTVKREIGGKFKMMEDHANMKLKIIDYERRPVQGCVVSLNRGGAFISGETSGEKGEVAIYTAGKVVEKLIVSMLGYKNLEIDMNDFWGYRSSLRIVLSNSLNKYNAKAFIAKYTITKTKGIANTLNSIEPNNNIKLTRKRE